MEKVYTAASMMILALSSYAQNTFPSSGNVGIGTTNPMSKLEIVDGSLMVKTDPYSHIGLERSNGAAIIMGVTSGSFEAFFKSAGALKFLTNDDADPKIFIREDGNVGVGTVAPKHRLEVNGGSSKTHARFVGSFAGIQGIQVERSGGDNIRLVANYSGYGGGLESSSVLRFSVNGEGITNPAIFVSQNGQTGIGTTNPDSKLTIDGDIHAEEVRVDLSVPGPDYVFEEDYDLPPLESIHHYVKENKHLPEVPSAKEMEEKGIDLGEMNMLLLKKVEELTLHTIRQEEEIKKMKEEKASLQGGLEGRLEELTLHLIEQNSEIKNLKKEIQTLKSVNDEN